MLLAGLAGGVAAAMGVTRLMRSLLVEIQPADPAVLAGSVLLLFLAGLGAAAAPAIRARPASIRCAL